AILCCNNEEDENDIDDYEEIERSRCDSRSSNQKNDG
ncbi:hypothetical protein Tco_1239643, partial [Tanacetum coccineum]